MGKLLLLVRVKNDRSLSIGQIDTAYRRREKRLYKEPLATAVRYMPSRDTVVVEMNNGAALVIPRHLLQGLANGSPAQLRIACVAARGTAVSWPELDADFTIVSLLHGIYGGKRWMSELARHAGAAKSEAKAKAARINRVRGGRPKGVAPAKR
jgi:hypothetical protein